MFDIDDRDIKRMERDLKTFAERSLPFATKNTMNRSAFHAQKLAKADIRRDLTLRNKFTEQSIRVDQTKTLNIRRQEAVVGSTADYMEDQEFGGVKAKRGSEGVPIPTSYAAGQSENAQPRTRMPRKANKMSSIRLKRRQLANLIAKVQGAVRSGRRYIFHEFTDTKVGIFKVVGGSKKTKRGWPKGAKLKMVWDMSRPAIRIPRNPWLSPAVRDTEKIMPLFYRDSLVFQLKKQGLFNEKGG